MVTLGERFSFWCMPYRNATFIGFKIFGLTSTAIIATPTDHIQLKVSKAFVGFL